MQKHQHTFDQSFLILHFHLFLFFPLIVSYFGFNSRKKNLAKVPKLNNNGKVVIIMILALSFLPCVPKKYFCNNRQTKLQTRKDVRVWVIVVMCVGVYVCVCYFMSFTWDWYVKERMIITTSKNFVNERPCKNWPIYSFQAILYSLLHQHIPWEVVVKVHTSKFSFLNTLKGVIDNGGCKLRELQSFQVFLNRWCGHVSIDVCMYVWVCFCVIVSKLEILWVRFNVL